MPYATECLLWPGHVRSQDGYGLFIWAVRPNVYDRELAHRMAWRIEHGEIPDGVELHHLCGVKACINVDHLEALSPREHRRRHMKDACRYGHALTPDNCYVVPTTGHRQCRVCRRERQRKGWVPA